MKRLGFIQRSLVTLLIVAATTTPHFAATTWRPIPPEELAQERSDIDPTASAVVLLREITIDNGDFEGAVHAYYVRTKVFDQKGVDALVQMQIPYDKGQRPRDIAARVVRRDGSIVQVDPKTIMTRDVVRVGREALRVKSFSYPALEPGCILEYQYKIYSDNVLLGMHLPMSDDHPVATARIRMKNFSLPGLGIQSI
jgi:hypothetical protein